MQVSGRRNGVSSGTITTAYFRPQTMLWDFICHLWNVGTTTKESRSLNRLTLREGSRSSAGTETRPSDSTCSTWGHSGTPCDHRGIFQSAHTRSSQGRLCCQDTLQNKCWAAAWRPAGPSTLRLSNLKPQAAEQANKLRETGMWNDALILLTAADAPRENQHLLSKRSAITAASGGTSSCYVAWLPTNSRSKESTRLWS